MCTALWQRKRAQRCDSSGSDSAEVTMCTLVWQRWQLTVMWQRYQLLLLSQWCEHRCHSAVSCHRCLSAASATVVTPLSVVTDVTLVCTVMLQCCHCHRCYAVVSLHSWHINVVVIAVTVLYRPLHAATAQLSTQGPRSNFEIGGHH